MTLSTTNNRTSDAGNDITTAFSFPFLFFANDDLEVIVVVDSTGVETVQTITTDYTVAGAGVIAGGTVTMVSAPATGETLVIIRKEQFTQGLDLAENDPFPSASVEQQLDTLTMLAQQLNTELTRSVKLSDGDTSGADTTLAAPVANALIGWDATGLALTTTLLASLSSSLDINLTSLANLDFLRYDSATSKWINRTPTNALTDLGFSTFGKTLIDDANAAASRTTIGVVIGTDVYPETAVVTQAAAEAGTATAEKIWTAQRVSQAIASLGASADRQNFTSSGTWTKPSSGTVAFVEIWGGGGSGARGETTAGGGGGGGCTYDSQLFLLSDLGSTETVTIGAGGAVVTGATTNGNAGSNTTFGSLLTAYAGGAGAYVSGSGGGGGGGITSVGLGPTSGTPGAAGGGPAGGAGGPTTGDPGVSVGGFSGAGGGASGSGATAGGNGGESVTGGAGGGGGARANGVVGGTGGNSVNGGGGGGGGAGDTGGGAGGASIFGGNGGAGTFNSTVGVAGTQPGGGGGGSEVANSGAGAAGQCTVTVW